MGAAPPAAAAAAAALSAIHPLYMLWEKLFERCY
jgi:hypothetical protein